MHNPFAGLQAVNLNRLVVFVAVVEAGSLSEAARRLGIAKTMVSAHIRRLEAELGVSVMVRTTRRLELTEPGTRLYEASRRIVQAADDAIRAASSTSSEPRGTLRVTSPADYGERVVAPVLAVLSARHPSLNVEWIASDRMLDMVAERIDVAVRLGPPGDAGHKTVTIGAFERWLVASPALARGLKAKTPKQLQDEPFVGLSAIDKPGVFSFEGPKGVVEDVRFEPRFLASSTGVVRAALVAGAGLGVLPEFTLEDEARAGRLVRLLPSWRLAPTKIRAVFPSTEQTPRKVRAFVDAMVAAGAQTR
ncbi:MAG: LysR family transcriptional regulator [Polyangiaceae bacterium]|nr:LysR family transcriptional regulator [Polyangiaceae bacterium]